MGVDAFFEDFETTDNWCINALLPLIQGRGLSAGRYTTIAQQAKTFGLEKSADIKQFYKLLQRYSVRLLLHDLFRFREGAALSDLTNYASEKSALRVLTKLEKLGLVSQSRQRYKLNVPSNLRVGDVLEWFASVVLAKEFRVPVLSNVSIRGGESGGDYDLLGNWMGKLLFAEVKSAPPKGIHNPEIAAFLQRVSDLLPDIAIFLVDTHLRVKDKIILMFEEELIRLKGISSLQSHPIQRVCEQIFHLHHYIYVMNSKRDIKSNMSVVFRDYLRHQLKIDEIGL